MKIGIDLITISDKGAGLRRMGQQLIEGLVNFDHENQYTIFVNENAGDLFSIKKKNFKIIKIKTPPKIHYFYEQFYLPFRCLFEDFDILHSPVSALPYFSFKKSVITVPDLTFILYPETMTKIGYFYWKLFMGKGIKTASKIITISESTKRDLITYFHIPRNKIKVIHLYPTQNFKYDKSYTKLLKDKFNIPKRYILYLGTLQPRKNLTTLIKAYAILKKDNKIPHSLVIAGNKGWLYDNIFNLVKELDIDNDVIFTSFIPEIYLPSLYSGADLFAYLSLYEGFGLPPLEAMACGTPVLTSNTSSLPEVVGDAGILVNPNNIDDITCKMLKILKDDIFHQELRNRGLKRVKQFSIQKATKATIDVYREVIESR